MSATKAEVEKLINLKGHIAVMVEEMSEIEDNLMGLELMYQGDYASIMYVDGNKQNATLYVENESGENWEVILPLQELLDLI